LPLLLNIDTATEIASVCVSVNGQSVGYRQNGQQREHASFVHTAIAAVLKDAGFCLKDIDAFAVTSGPGSYTGLRVGMATAKGLCYALSKPLITVNTLEVMTWAALDNVENIDEDWLLCPMIDARRMEVFTGLYNLKMEIVLPPAPVVLEKSIFNNYMKNKKIAFFGSGSTKFRLIESNTNSVFLEIEHNAEHLGNLADKACQQKKFSDISYSEPNYFKDFHTIGKA
jgi:tRNA threonylcarbamoyladenosine biosynthesis protein TsaB